MILKERYQKNDDRRTIVKEQQWKNNGEKIIVNNGRTIVKEQ